MSKRKHILREKKYTQSCNWTVRRLHKGLTEGLTEKFYRNAIEWNSGLLIAHRMAKRLARERRYK
jgi:hypothetical protein